MKLSDIFTVAEWTKQVKLGFGLPCSHKSNRIQCFLCVLLMIFKNLGKMQFYENCVKKLWFDTLQMFDVFLRWLDQFV